MTDSRFFSPHLYVKLEIVASHLLVNGTVFVVSCAGFSSGRTLSHSCATSFWRMRARCLQMDPNFLSNM